MKIRTDSARPERRQCEIGAFETERRHTDNGTDKPGRQGCEWQGEPERQPELGAEHGRGIGADCRQGDVTNIHLPGEALDDVETDRQHDVDHDQIEQILLVAIGDRQRQREQQRQRRHPSGILDGTRQRRGTTALRGPSPCLLFVGHHHGSLERCAHRPSRSLVACGGIRSRRVRHCRGRRPRQWHGHQRKGIGSAPCCRSLRSCRA